MRSWLVFGCVLMCCSGIDAMKGSSGDGCSKKRKFSSVFGLLFSKKKRLGSFVKKTREERPDKEEWDVFMRKIHRSSGRNIIVLKEYSVPLK